MCPTALELSHLVRRQWHIRGQVQGVGFRPFVYRLARRNRLTGFVRNDTTGVYVQVQGLVDSIERFSRALRTERPPLAHLDDVQATALPVLADEDDFRIVASEADVETNRHAQAAVTIDSAVCPDCLREMRDSADQRHRYGLINCTNCGPRYSIVQRVPYDRPNTTMSGFTMCGVCKREYTDPIDRRFHAQPIACNDCGPVVSLVSQSGRTIAGDPYKVAARLLQDGQIIAMKGIGGFHLVTRADDADAVARLRQKKQRDHKPFAVMCRCIETARRIAQLSEKGEASLLSPKRPIVLGRRIDRSQIAHGVAPGMHRLGIMLPYTPMQHLLFDALPCSIDMLVMTSGNLSDEPLVIDNDEAVARLGALCDAILWHDRPIQRCVDDTVVLDMADGAAPLPVRRARGEVPTGITLPFETDDPGLCVGGELKNTVAVVRNGEVILSQHLGDLTHALALDYFRRAIDDLCDLFDVQPKWIAHDLHPMYMSTADAGRLARKLGVPLIPIQHHHAHAASVMIEHGQTEPTLAVICDGVGYGDDGTSWGGELLLADMTNYKRLAHLQPLQLPGMDAAARDTRRCALAMLFAAFGRDFDSHPAAIRMYPAQQERQMLAAMIRRNFNCAGSSAAGRVFDAAAALMGVCDYNHFEAEAPMLLEALAAQSIKERDTQRHYTIRDNQIDFSSLVPQLVADMPTADRAALLHDQMAMAWADVVTTHVADTGVQTVALSGGVFCNERLTQQLTNLLTQQGLTVLRHQRVPANDGGLVLGQAAIAVMTRKAGA